VLVVNALTVSLFGLVWFKIDDKSDGIAVILFGPGLVGSDYFMEKPRFGDFLGEGDFGRFNLI
jgi:hypothetical protein